MILVYALKGCSNFINNGVTCEHYKAMLSQCYFLPLPLVSCPLVFSVKPVSAQPGVHSAQVSILQSDLDLK